MHYTCIDGLTSQIDVLCIDGLTHQTVKKQPIIQITKYKYNIHSWWWCLLTKQTNL